MFHIAALVLVVALITALAGAIGVYGVAATVAGTVRVLFMSILAFALLFHLSKNKRHQRILSVQGRERLRHSDIH